MKTKRVAVYVRVSTSNQTVENQLNDLTKYAVSRGWEYLIFKDEGFSGAKREKDRPALKDLMERARKKQFDVVLVWRFDRFARSTIHLVGALEEFNHLGIDFVSFQENIDTSSPLGRALFTIGSAFAQMEREVLRERIVCALRRAREHGRLPGPK